MSFRLTAVLSLVVLTLPSAFADTPAAWRLDRFTRDGMRVDVREVAGSSFEEVRVSTRIALPLQSLCDAVWGKGQKAVGDFKKRVVISETDTDRWTYEQVHVPLIADRDMVMHVKLEQPAETGRCEVSFETGEHPSWPATTEYVRLRAVRGHWSLVPQSDGTVGITYVIYSDPGGQVPAFLARGGTRDAAVSFMKNILQRAQAK